MAYDHKTYQREYQRKWKLANREKVLAMERASEGDVVPPNVGEDVTPPDAPDTTDQVDQTPKEPTEAEAPQEDAPSEPVETDKEKLARKIAESKARREAEKKESK